jgi:hypothetical protein
MRLCRSFPHPDSERSERILSILLYLLFYSLDLLECNQCMKFILI